MLRRLFSLKGRIGRAEFVLVWVGACALFAAPFSLLFSFFPRAAIEPSVVIAFGFSLLIVAYLQVAATLKRLHDFGYPSELHHWIVLLPYQPTVLIFVFIPGDPESNQFGPPAGPLLGGQNNAVPR